METEDLLLVKTTTWPTCCGCVAGCFAHHNCMIIYSFPSELLLYSLQYLTHTRWFG